MGSFAPDWLACRESADVLARSAALTTTLTSQLPTNRPVSAVDLAAGTGANPRYLIDRLPHRQSWLLVDRDAALLAIVPHCIGEWAATRGYSFSSERNEDLIAGRHLQCRVVRRVLDITMNLDDVLGGDVSLVTASALLDLVSDPWLELLAVRCRSLDAAVLFALTYDGRVRCAPADQEDEHVIELVNRHQRTDKGFGPALGPEAVLAAERHFRTAGYTVQLAASDWHLDPDQTELQRALVTGWATAATEMTPAEARTIDAWRQRRLGHIARGTSEIIVGHQDLGAWSRLR